MTPKLIGITGRAGSGKTTLAKFIRDQPENATIIPFAGPVKSIAYQMGWNGEKDAKGRRLLQLLGTECGRECVDPNIWVRKWAIDARNELNTCCTVIADDVRFPNEAAKIRELGGVIVRVVRDGCEPSDHASETLMDGITADYTINNNGTPAELEAEAKELMERMR